MSFTVSYEGDSLKSNTMDVRYLAPAMLSMGKVFDDANKALNGENVSIKVQVRALKSGSFQIDFEVCQSMYSQISGFLTGDFITSALNLHALIFETFFTIKMIKGRKAKKIKNLDKDQVRIGFDGETMDIPLKVFTLLQNNNLRYGIEQTLKPLELDGIDNFYVKEKEKIIADVDKDSYKYFKFSETESEIIAENEYESAYSIVSLTFKEKNKWKLSDGQVTINAFIRDEEFIEKVDKNIISFSKGDILICQVRVTQKMLKGELKTEYEVTKVKEHKSVMKQMFLFEKSDNQS